TQVGHEDYLNEISLEAGQGLELPGRQAVARDRHRCADRGLLGEAARRFRALEALRPLVQELDELQVPPKPRASQLRLRGRVAGGQPQAGLARELDSEIERGADP